MIITKLIDETKKAIPLIAALPYAIYVESNGGEASISYNPDLQRTFFAANRHGFSTCRENESVWPLFGQSKSDTKKDD